MIKNARSVSKKLVPEKSDATKKYNDGEYSEGEIVYIHRRVDMQRDALKNTSFISKINLKTIKQLMAYSLFI